jgi:hypothetical protein
VQQLSFDDLETWSPVPGYEGLYEVSDHGRVLSIRRRGTCGGIVTPFMDKSGYPVVRLWAHNAKRKFGVHQVVAMAFIGPCPPGQEVRHLDGDSMNPRRSNLAYGTHAENMHDMAVHGTSQKGRLRSHCYKGGHVLTQENTYISPNGRRFCRACRDAANERYAARQRAKREAVAVAQRTHCKHGHRWIPENIYVDRSGRERCRPCMRDMEHRYKAKMRAKLAEVA